MPLELVVMFTTLRSAAAAMARKDLPAPGGDRG